MLFPAVGSGDKIIWRTRTRAVTEISHTIGWIFKKLRMKVQFC